LEVVSGLQNFSACPDQDGPITQQMILHVEWTGDEFKISGVGDDDFELSLVSALDSIYRRIHSQTIESMPDHVAMGAACGLHGGRTFLLAGPTGAGKTTLAIALMLAGFDIAGDVLVFILNGEAVPLPRKFQLPESGVAMIPRLAALEQFGDVAKHPHAERMVMLDPRGFGRPWHVSPAPVSAVFYLEPNFGGRTLLRRCPTIEMMRHVIPLCAPPASRRKHWLADLSATVDGATTAIIELGDIDSAVIAVTEALG
jgi:hypothetical protein